MLYSSNIHTFTLLILATASLLLSQSTEAKPQTCLAQFIQDSEAQTDRLEVLYQNIDPDFKSIAKQNRPFVIPGKKKELAILVHGFMGSPDEMLGLALQANALGATAYSALIPGFGATAKVANQFNQEQWQLWLSQEISRAQKCFQKIHLLGFSTGGLLETNYLIDHPTDPTIASVTLISPYYKTHNVFYSILQQASARLLNEIPVSIVHQVLKYPDVEVMTKVPESYLQSVPLQTSLEIVNLGKIVQHKTIPTTQVPALLFTSDDDQVIDQDKTIEISSRLFRSINVESKKPNPGEARIPHHMMAHSVSLIAPELEDQVSEFLKNQISR
jgi:alpha-beta hydrolase superfamily lysophospholipase